MNFIDPQMTASSKWHGAGLHLGKVNNQKLEQILVARNVGGETTVVRGKIPYTKNNGEVVSINIPPTNIAPNSTKTINLQDVIDAANVPASVKYAGLEMNYSTPKGSVIMSAVSVNADNNQVFQVPLYDPQKTPPSAGGYPWKADGDFTTVVYIKNDTDQPQKYVASLHYEGGGYTLGVKEIKPHQLAVIDFRQLRDNQTPDANGNIIPFNIERGQIAWSGKRTPSGALNGRSSQISLSKGISSTYDCRNFCRDSYYDGYLIYDLPLQYVYDVANFEAYQQDMNAYGQPITPYLVSANWQSTDETVASIYGTGSATALAGGTTYIQGSWLAERFIGEVGNEECNFEDFNALVEEFLDILDPNRQILSFRQEIINESSQGQEVVECGLFNVTVKYKVGCPPPNHTIQLIGHIETDAILLGSQQTLITNDSNELCTYETKFSYRMKNRLSQAVGTGFTSYTGKLTWNGKSVTKEGPGISTRATIVGTGACPN
ncbi:hypothetical protein BH20ACI1_BH20ACI1_13830 [soil metagenome]